MTTTTRTPARPVPIDTAKTRAWREDVLRRRGIVTSACDLIDVATDNIRQPLPALVAALLTRLLGHPVRPSQVDELVEARDELARAEGDFEASFWSRRVDDLTAAIAAGPVGGLS